MRQRERIQELQSNNDKRVRKTGRISHSSWRGNELNWIAIMQIFSSLKSSLLAAQRNWRLIWARDFGVALSWQAPAVSLAAWSNSAVFVLLLSINSRVFFFTVSALHTLPTLKKKKNHWHIFLCLRSPRQIKKTNEIFPVDECHFILYSHRRPHR